MHQWDQALEFYLDSLPIGSLIPYNEIWMWHISDSSYSLNINAQMDECCPLHFLIEEKLTEEVFLFEEFVNGFFGTNW